MSYLQLLILMLFIALCLYTIVDRICNCLEKCHTIDAFGNFAKANGHDASIDDE